MEVGRAFRPVRAWDFVAARGVAPEAGSCARMIAAGAAGESGTARAQKLGFHLVKSCFWDYGMIPEIDMKTTSIYICTAGMAFSI